MQVHRGTIKMSTHTNSDENETTVIAAATLTEITAPAVPKRRFAQPRALQSRTAAEDIVRVREHITNVQTNAALAACLADRGIGAAELAEGLARQENAAVAFDRRQQAIGEAMTATAALALASDEFTAAYVEFRTIARLALKTPAARTALGLPGRLPQDTREWMAHAHAAYTAALEMPEYLDALQTVNYPAERLTALLARLDALYDVLSIATRAKSEALRATQERNRAIAEMQAWYLHFKTIARFATRGRPDLKPLVGL